MNIKHLLISSAIAVPLAATAASAATVSFDVDGPGSSAEITSQGPTFFAGIDVDTVDNLDDVAFDLEVGETSAVFDFLEFTVGGILAIDTEFEVEATLAFSDPGGSSDFDGGGTFGTILGIFSGGELEWTTNDILVDLGTGTKFTVTLEDVDFIAGFGNSATVGASVTLNAVPLPASSLLLLAGLGGLGIAARRKRAA